MPLPFGSFTSASFSHIVFSSSHQSELCLFDFFVSHGRVPSSLAIQVIRPSRWLPGITVLWGLVMTLMGFVKTHPQLVGVRSLRFLPGYSGAFSGLLAYAIDYMDGDGGLEGWSWILILEGVVTMLLGFIAAFVMDYPATAKFLTTEERSFVIEKRRRDAAQDEEYPMSQQVWAAFTDWQVWALATVQVSIAVPLFGIAYFLPTIINDFGYSTSLSQLLTVPPYALASEWTINLGLLIALLAYIINISDAPSGVKYFGTYFLYVGSDPPRPLDSDSDSHSHLPPAWSGGPRDEEYGLMDDIAPGLGTQGSKKEGLEVV
ncbi:hypothetical protein PAXINDRAFT_13176 [Paxillus involutus ATCC 200175]|uniref:Uncharacterized protein n=1 Tax=Paxillus involutus ATCC 200175 TaxID=664439 RepID=A0A0C9TEN4_PAXIN|nr:hypothetical protein PAXINDRAFT_13176 [Paxillus involutus ATCC 200175]